MKKKSIDKETRVNGYCIRSAEAGFMGDKGEGKDMLLRMGLNPDIIPFSMASLLKEGEAHWNDKFGRKATVSFKISDDCIDFSSSYMGHKKTKKIYREWDEYESPERIMELESEAIGNLCMMCIYEKIIE